MSEFELDRTIWQGRIDPPTNNLRWAQDVKAQANSWRWHQVIAPFDWKAANGTVLVGFCCDEGVRRNGGRIGAKDAPNAIRRALANFAWHGTKPIYDDGNIYCNDGDLESAQRQLALKLSHILYCQNHVPIVLGGGHEVAFASWLGLMLEFYDFLDGKVLNPKPINIGIINFDAHFDLRAPQISNEVEDEEFQWIVGKQKSIGSSGTPFAQISNAFNSLAAFHYAVLGISRPSNTKALFDCAEKLNTWVVEDKDINAATLPAISAQLENWLQDKTHVYVSFDIDVLPAHQAPACSAPASLGVDLNLLLPLLEIIKQSGKLKIADIAEVNPKFDIDNRTAKAAARIVELLAR